MNDNSKLTGFISPYLNYINNGSFFRKIFTWLYIAIGILNLLVPLFTLYQVAGNNILKLLDGKYLFILVFVWIIIFIAGILSFMLWWNRKKEINRITIKDKEFVVTPVLCHFIQTLGEWAGTWIAIVGFFIAVILTLGFGDEAESISESIGTDFLGTGILSIIKLPMAGFIIIVISRFVAEQFRAIMAIANNTTKENRKDNEAEIED